MPTPSPPPTAGPPSEPMTPEDVRAWGKHTHGSPLYAHLVEVIAGDPELMRVLNRIEHLPQMNLLLGGVQDLLFSSPDEELAAYYQSLTPNPLPPTGADRRFRDFVLGREVDLVAIGNTRFTQTNECRRCVALLPMLMSAGLDRFHLIEIGTSAGLNLAIDRYRYRWGEVAWGSPASPLTLVAESRGVPFPLHDIDVLSRVGLDLEPIRHDDEGGRRWLDALIWPEHTERRARLRTAFDVAATLEIEMVSGDAIETLPAALEALPRGEPVVVMDAFSLNQLTVGGRRRIEEIADAARGNRPVFRASMEVLDKADDWARLCAGSGLELPQVGQAHPHGEWIELWEVPSG